MPLWLPFPGIDDLDITTGKVPHVARGQRGAVRMRNRSNNGIQLANGLTGSFACGGIRGKSVCCRIVENQRAAGKGLVKNRANRRQ